MTYQATGPAPQSLDSNGSRAAHEPQENNTPFSGLSQAMLAHGLTCPTDLEPGKHNRFPGAGKDADNLAGWVMPFGDGTGAIFGDWSSGLSEVFRLEPAEPLTDEEEAAFREQTRVARKQAEKARKAAQDRAAIKAKEIWEKAAEVTEHPYLKEKDVPPLGIKKDLASKLIIPLRNPAGEIRTLQFIDHTGQKKFFSSGEISGNYFAIGRPTPDDDTILICEGYATGASLRQSCCIPVGVAFNTGNLKPVALAIRSKFPDHKIVVAADDDHLTPGNPGLTKAKEAAAAVGGFVAVPDFGPDRPDGFTDFNDLEVSQGGHAVLYCVQKALEAGGTNVPTEETTQKQPQVKLEKTDRYTETALQKAVDAVRTAPEGSRNHELNRQGHGLYGLALAGRLDEHEVTQQLTAAATAAGLSDSEIAATLASAQKAAQPREGKFYHLTELGNAERFADQHGANVRYVSAWKKWIHCDGRRWRAGAEDEVRRLAQQTAKSLYKLAADAADTEQAGKLAKWAASSCRSASITAMLREAQALLGIDVRLLDSDPFLFNCWNCTINFKTGKLQPHNREDFITRITSVSFDPEAQAPLFESVVNTAFAGNRNLIDFVQRYAGYSMTGSTKEQCIAIWHGTGANGKSTIENAVADALGEYAQATRPETLMVRKGENTSDLAKLKGARLVTAAEAEDGHRLAESQIKMMTGGEKLQCRFLYGEWFEYMPEFKITLLTNHKPIIRGDDHAIWRRIRLVPFTVTIPEADRDPDLPEKLRRELPGILKWCVAGAAKWLTDGLGHPEEIREATANYQTEQNVIGIFLECCCVIRPEATAEAGLLFQEFDKWRTAEGHRKITQTKFGRMLTQMGFQKERGTTGRNMYIGIGINA